MDSSGDPRESFTRDILEKARAIFFFFLLNVLPIKSREKNEMEYDLFENSITERNTKKLPKVSFWFTFQLIQRGNVCFLVMQ
jgi:hypothetical protein